MKLKIWLVINKITITAFAEEVGITRTHLGEIINGRRKSGSTLAKLIEIKTNGEVKAEELMKGDLLWKETKFPDQKS